MEKLVTTGYGSGAFKDEIDRSSGVSFPYMVSYVYLSLLYEYFQLHLSETEGVSELNERDVCNLPTNKVGVYKYPLTQILI